MRCDRPGAHRTPAETGQLVKAARWLARVYGVSAERIGLYILPLSVGNFLGPLLLGRFFDTVGRRRMISTTFGLAGLLLIVTGVLIAGGRFPM